VVADFKWREENIMLVFSYTYSPWCNNLSNCTWLLEVFLIREKLKFSP